MTEKQAIHYGQVEIIPGIQCDGYVLNDGTACLSERGTGGVRARLTLLETHIKKAPNQTI